MYQSKRPGDKSHQCQGQSRMPLFHPLVSWNLFVRFSSWHLPNIPNATSKVPCLRTVVGDRESLVLGAVQIGELEPKAAYQRDSQWVLIAGLIGLYLVLWDHSQDNAGVGVHTGQV